MATPGSFQSAGALAGSCKLLGDIFSDLGRRVQDLGSRSSVAAKPLRLRWRWGFMVGLLFVGCFGVQGWRLEVEPRVCGATWEGWS